MIDSPIAFYCERTTFGLWSEPLNLISNVSFLIAGLYAYRLISKANINSIWLVCFAINIVIISIGSTILHLLSNKISFIIDSIPIVIFIVSTLYYTLNKGLQLSKLNAIAIIVTMLLAIITIWYISPFEHYITISIIFVPVILTLLIISSVFAVQKIKTSYTRKLSRIIGLTCALFTISVVVRTLDMPLCTIFPNGFHFIWHIINAFVCYLIFYACYIIHLYRTKNC